jgi:hypothetical protein
MKNILFTILLLCIIPLVSAFDSELFVGDSGFAFCPDGDLCGFSYVFPSGGYGSGGYSPPSGSGEAPVVCFYPKVWNGTDCIINATEDVSVRNVSEESLIFGNESSEVKPESSGGNIFLNIYLVFFIVVVCVLFLLLFLSFFKRKDKKPPKSRKI